MRKIIFLFIAIFSLHGVGYSQTGKTIKPTTKSVAGKSAITKPESEIVKENAEKWFKDVYVEKFFKDPYSYRLMGLKAIPVTIKEAFLRELSNIQYNIDTCTIAKADRTQESYDECMRLYEQNLKDIEKEKEKINQGGNAEYCNKRIAIYQKYGNEILSIAKGIKLYLFDIGEKEKLENTISQLTEEQSNMLAYYDVRLDCYSKNSLGNDVLGRFSFPFTIKGVLGDNNGIDKVIQLNK